MIMNKLENIFYVYKYTDSENTPIYIGMGKNKRMYKHLEVLNDEKYKNVYFYKKLRALISNKQEFFIIKLHDNLTRKEAIEIEKYYIAYYGRRCNKTGILYNLTSGGDGGVAGLIREETREKLRKNWLGKKHTPESIEKMRRVQKGLKHKKLTEEQLVLHRQVVIDRWKNPEYKEKQIKLVRNKVKRKIKEIKETGEIIIYESQFDIPFSTKSARWRISQCCRGLRKTFYKSRWEYIE